MANFIDIGDHKTATLKALIASGVEMKAKRDKHSDTLKGKAVALLFEKPSTRTRVSFEVGVKQLGGDAVVLRGEEMQLGRGETIADTAKVLSRYVDMVMLRTTSHAIIEEFAEHASVPIINGLTDKSHPCQVMADVMTLAEKKAPKQDYSALKVAWLGDGNNNVAYSWIEAAGQFGFSFACATPSARSPDTQAIKKSQANGSEIIVTEEVAEAVKEADLVVTDTWLSMGASMEEGGIDEKLLKPYQVNAEVMALAKSDAIFMHCLPVYRGMEATAEVVDGAQSVIWDEAENRLHIQKAIMLWCLGHGE